MNDILQKDIIIYNSEDGEVSFNVNVFDDTIWLTQKQMAELFDKSIKTISEHINNIFSEGELKKDSVIRKFRNTTQHGALQGKTQTKEVNLYNLDVIISVGYRVKSQRGIQFRQWATRILKQYLMNGYAINNARLDSLEKKIDNLSTELKSEFRAEIHQIQRTLLEIANKPINIYNQISLTSNKLEEKIIELLDQIILQAKSDSNLQGQLQEVEDAIKSPVKDIKTKNKISKFFTDLANPESKLHKNIKGINVTTTLISELINLGKKLKNLFD